MLLGALSFTLAAVVAAVPLARLLGRAAGFVLALPLLTAAASLVIAWQGAPSAETYPWIPSLGVHLALRLDGLSLVFGLLVTVIGAGVLVYSAKYLERERHARYFLLMTTFALAMLALVLADDVVVLFVAWEVTTLCSFFLIARSGPTAREPAIRTLLVTVLGGLALLAAVITLVVVSGTTRLSEILDAPFWTEQPGATTWIIVLLALAAFTKSAQFPFQSWLPDSMVAITPVSTYLHAAAMVKAGIYLLLRFSPPLHDEALWMTLLITSGAVTALLGAFSAMRQTDLKALLAFSTMSQLGLLVLLIGVGTEAAITAAIVHTIAHALFKAALFMVIGIVDHQAGTRDLRELRSLHLRMPVTRTVAVVAALSMAGIPPLLGFVSKEGMFEALLHADSLAWLPLLATAAAAVTAVMTVAYSGRLVLALFGGGERTVREGAFWFWLVPALCIGTTVALGFMPGLLDVAVSAAATTATGTPVITHLSLWHGFTVALGVSAIVIAIGALLIWRRASVERVLQPLRTPIAGTEVVDRLRAATIALGGHVSRWSGRSTPRRHMMIPVVCVVVIAALCAPLLGTLPPVVGDPSQPFDWVLVAFVLVGTVAAIVARTRVSAIVVTGVVGFAMTIWFFWLGAADVALTQLLVEILTVCVMVLVLRRLPRTFKKDSRRRRLSSGAIAVAAGVVTTLAVLALTGRRELSAAAEYFLGNAEAETGGSNIVNTILVDFRAFDTLGELTVLGIAGVAIAALLSAHRVVPVPKLDDDERYDSASPLAHAAQNAVFTRTMIRWAGPLTVVISVILLFRGHYEPGGGFIAALVGGAGFALLYLAAPTERAAPIKWPYLTLIGLGVAVATATGLLGYIEGSFLRPLHGEILGMSLTSALLFDIGVYLAVIGIVLAALNVLGLDARKQRSSASDAEADDERRSTALQQEGIAP
ncbi:DUF4040 family protein [Humidisolicoccus flavus]|uniref:DUF4040 family protein n=1 Tax=Humidisolicoccus flavus TaxID=3111414 RepID=UPI003253F0DE